MPDFSPKDAIGEECLQIDKIMRGWGYESEIRSLSTPFRRLENLENTLILYHYSIGSRMPYFILEWGLEFAVRFHNITPSEFFSNCEEDTLNACELGWRQLPLLVERSRYFLAVSQFNAEALKRAGAQKTSVVPILREYKRFEKKHTYENPRTQFLFVGRFSPNKCQHDLLEAFDLYKRFVDPGSRLVLVGGAFSTHYSRSLLKMAQELELKVGFDLASDVSCDVLLVKNLSEKDLIRLYQESSLFMSMSEHEGFCVPLVEAMHAELPILAHGASAVPETLGDAGILFDKKDKVGVVREMERLVKDSNLRKDLMERGKARARNYSLEASSALLKKFLQEISD